MRDSNNENGGRWHRGDFSGFCHDPVISLMLLSFKTKVKALTVMNERRAAIYEDIGNELINGYLRQETYIGIVRSQFFHCAPLPMVFGSRCNDHHVSLSSYRENTNVFIRRGLVHRFYGVDPAEPYGQMILYSLPELNEYYMNQGEAVYRNYLGGLAQCDDKTLKSGSVKNLRTNPPRIYCEWVGAPGSALPSK